MRSFKTPGSAIRGRDDGTDIIANVAGWQSVIDRPGLPAFLSHPIFIGAMILNHRTPVATGPASEATRSLDEVLAVTQDYTGTRLLKMYLRCPLGRRRTRLEKLRSRPDLSRQVRQESPISHPVGKSLASPAPRYRTWLEKASRFYAPSAPAIPDLVGNNVAPGWKQPRTRLETHIAPGWREHRTWLEEISHLVGNLCYLTVLESSDYNSPKFS